MENICVENITDVIYLSSPSLTPETVLLEYIYDGIIIYCIGIMMLEILVIMSIYKYLLVKCLPVQTYLNIKLQPKANCTRVLCLV